MAAAMKKKGVGIFLRITVTRKPSAVACAEYAQVKHINDACYVVTVSLRVTLRAEYLKFEGFIQSD